MQSVSTVTSKSTKLVILALASTLSAPALFAMDMGGFGAGLNQDPLVKAVDLYARGAIAYEAAKPLFNAVVNRVLGRQDDVENKWWAKTGDEGKFDYVGRMLSTAGALYGCGLVGGKQIARMAGNVKKEVEKEIYGADHGKNYGIDIGVNPEIWNTRLIRNHVVRAKDEKGKDLEITIPVTLSLQEVQELYKDMDTLRQSKKRTAQEKKDLYKQMAKKWHPDKAVGRITKTDSLEHAQKRYDAYFQCLNELATDIGASSKANSKKKSGPGLLRRIAGSLFN